MACFLLGESMIVLVTDAYWSLGPDELVLILFNGLYMYNGSLVCGGLRILFL